MLLSDRFICAGTAMCDMYRSVPAPYFRKNVVLRDEVLKAELTICGLGFYELYCNGENLTKGLLSPYISNSNQLMDYDTYDITAALRKGRNTLGFLLGNGMQNAFGGYVWDFDKASFRSAPKMAVHVRIEQKDGEVIEFEADETFRTAPSPITYDDLRMGERYDARAEIDGWNLPEFDDSDWQPAQRAVTPLGDKELCAAKPIVPDGEIHPVSITKMTMQPCKSGYTEEGYVYDFGVNIAGLCRLKIRGDHGQKVNMTFGETLRDGKFYIDNIRFPRPEYLDLPLYLQRDEYTCRGDREEVYQPRFTYHGFRYVLVSGITPEQATPELLTYVVYHTQMQETGAFHCSDETLNRIQKMVRVSTLANFYHFPTDCPHREKNGWTADAALSAEHTLLNLEPEDNYYEWMRHIRRTMRPSGELPGIIPTDTWGYAWGNGPAWDAILVTLPYFVYRYCGNRKIVEENLTSLLRYVQYLTTRTRPDGLIAIGLGDWCPPEGLDFIKAPLELTDTIESLDICEKTAFLFRQFGGKRQADFCQSVADDFRAAIRAHLIDFDTMTVAGNCQTSQAMAIYYHVFTAEEKPAALRVLVDMIHAADDHLGSGVLGMRVLLHLLSDNGYADLAYKMVTAPTEPSYAAWLSRGATALAEDFMQKSREASLNHHFFGDVSAWFIKGICGIHFNPDADDLTYARICPHFVSTLTEADAYHTAPGGKIAVKWERDDADTVRLQLEFPAALHGELQSPEGWQFTDGTAQKPAATGSYTLQRIH